MTAINPIYETFKKHRKQLEREHGGSYALVSANEIVAIYAGAGDAAAALRARFSAGPMIVYHIGHDR